jgi:hypothetical protein
MHTMQKATKKSASSPFDVSGSNGNNSSSSSSVQPVSIAPSQIATNVDTKKLTHIWWKSFKTGFHAYIASLIIVGTFIPIVASLITVVIYLTPLSKLTSAWDPLLYGICFTGILWFAAAFPVCAICTAQGANPRNYALLQSRLHQLQASIDLKDYDDGPYPEIHSLNTVLENAGFDENKNKHRWEVGKEVFACCIDISCKLYKFPSGLLWAIGSGYNCLWMLLHHAEEAMIELSDVGTVIRGAKHDFLSIQGSMLSGRDGLLDDVIHSVAVLKPEALTYFQEQTLSKRGMERRKVIKSGTSSQKLQAADDTSDREQLEIAARLTLREVRSTLNDFRDKRWEGLVRQRNHLLKSIAVTGLATYVLLAVIILSFNLISSIVLTDQKFLQEGVIIYLIGAMSGLFVRFYSESQGGTTIDDFGLTTTRLVATPLLSGLAAIGGVLFTQILGSIAAQNSVPDLFTLKQVQILLTAAVFGASPNLFIKGLQKQANDFEADLQSSKAAGSPAGDA